MRQRENVGEILFCDRCPILTKRLKDLRHLQCIPNQDGVGDSLALSGYRAMWLFAMFELPVDKPELRRGYSQFRATLMKQGFTILLFSVCVHYVASKGNDETLRRK